MKWNPACLARDEEWEPCVASYCNEWTLCGQQLMMDGKPVRPASCRKWQPCVSSHWQGLRP